MSQSQCSSIGRFVFHRRRKHQRLGHFRIFEKYPEVRTMGRLGTLSWNGDLSHPSTGNSKLYSAVSRRLGGHRCTRKILGEVVVSSTSIVPGSSSKVWDGLSCTKHRVALSALSIEANAFREGVQLAEACYSYLATEAGLTSSLWISEVRRFP